MKLTLEEIKSMTDEKLLETYNLYLSSKGIFEGAWKRNDTAVYDVLEGAKGDLHTHFFHAGNNLKHNMPRYDAPLHIPTMQLWDNK